jgi:hypothetical protein
MFVLLAYVNCEPTETGVSFTWEGAWEFDQVSGNGSVRLGKDGDDSTFIAERAEEPEEVARLVIGAAYFARVPARISRHLQIRPRPSRPIASREGVARAHPRRRAGVAQFPAGVPRSQKGG